jgi:hypothetical protein
VATFNYQFSDANVGEMIGPPDGFLVDLAMTQGAQYEQPDWDPGRLRWKTAYLVLRGQHDLKDLVCVSPQDNHGSFCWRHNKQGVAIGEMVVDGSPAYRGSLVIGCVPRGSSWRLTLSDTANVRASDPPVLGKVTPNTSPDLAASGVGTPPYH